MRTLLPPIIAWLLAATVLVGASWVRADDDDWPQIPIDPGPGYAGILPTPPQLPGLRLDQSTSPYGVRQVFNTPEVHLGQSFTPDSVAADWVAFVFQNNTQPGDSPGPGYLRVSLHPTLNTATGQLGEALAVSPTVEMPSDTTQWLLFTFADRIPLVPGTRYFLHVEQVSGYPCWVGGRLSNTYFGGSAFGYFYDAFGGTQNLQWTAYDLNFAVGTIEPVDAYQTWAEAFPGFTVTAEAADPDHDGMPNLLEVALGSNPTRPDPSHAPQLSRHTVADATHAQLDIVRNPLATNITFVVESSPDLLQWHSGGGHTVVVQEDPSTLKVRDAEPLGPTPRFLRLRVVRP
jgi:hypothetical protein